MDSYMKAYETWDYTRQSMDHWAQLTRERLDAAREESPGTSPGNATDSVR